MHERQPTDDLLLLACDGLWDVMTNSEAVAQVRELFQSGEVSVAKIAEEMLDVSLNKGECFCFIFVCAIIHDSTNFHLFPTYSSCFCCRLQGQHQCNAGEAPGRGAGS